MMSHSEIPKQHPFSLYDFIGYFIPGSIFLFLVLLIDKLGDGVCNVCSFVKKLAIACDQSFLHSFASLAFFFALSYFLGHGISILSNIMVEKSFLCKHHNFLYFLYMKKENKKLIPKWNRWEWIFKWNWVLDLLLGYIYIYEWICKRFDGDPRHEKWLDPARSKIFRKSIKAIIKGKYKVFVREDEKHFFDLTKDENYFFDCLYHYAVEKGVHSSYRMQNYVALYGFMRNMCMVFCIFFWLTVLLIVSHKIGIVKHLECAWCYAALFIFSFLGFITMYGLNKYKKRFTLEVLHAVSVLALKK